MLYASPRALNIMEVTEQTTKAVPVGISAASAVHLRLPVSLRMVRSVVAQGQCSRLNSMVLSAVR